MHASSVFSSVLGLAFAATLHAAPPISEHHDHVASAVAVAPAQAERWATDAPLREGMARVRIALDELRHHEHGHMTDGQARERVVTIEAAVASMFGNCRLAPEPDAVLHAILAPLLAAARRLDADPADKDAIAAMREAVAPYARQFDDPQWQADAPVPVGDAHAH